MCGTVKLDASVQTGETCKAKQNTATKMLRVDLLQKNQMDTTSIKLPYYSSTTGSFNKY